MTERQVWDRLVDKLRTEPAIVKTTPTTNRIPKVFSATTDGDSIHITGVPGNRNSCSISGHRKIDFANFAKVYPIYLRRKQGHAVSAEAVAATFSSVYIYALISYAGI